MQRLNGIKEASVRAEIKSLKENLEVEKEVSAKILSFINRRRDIVQDVSDKRDKLRENEISKLQDERQVIITKKDEADQEIDRMNQKCQEEEEMRQQQQKLDDDAAEEERQKEK